MVEFVAVAVHKLVAVVADIHTSVVVVEAVAVHTVVEAEEHTAAVVAAAAHRLVVVEVVAAHTVVVHNRHNLVVGCMHSVVVHTHLVVWSLHLNPHLLHMDDLVPTE